MHLVGFIITTLQDATAFSEILLMQYLLTKTNSYNFLEPQITIQNIYTFNDTVYVKNYIVFNIIAA